ncbi:MULTISPECIES: CotH kinase family protein [unclassified Flavobacterium]|uniref:CotH kinase family protein n=1 Tax=unclassified Flavobacterium TaxID=196869 RepID=UPI001F14071F|nr:MULTISPECIES: CotH kinase family protein [unclassified Flavobacterium]UMY66723.1 CotH kinase family protein [Flavobacterium sp. HJ-32-4]
MRHLFVSFLLCCSLWTYAQVLTESNLPIVWITTDGGQEIPDEPKIPASMKIVYRGAGQTTYVSDATNPDYIDYNGRIAIEVRGSSSQALPKKQYSFTTKLPDDSDDLDAGLLGMPEESDWIFNGLAFDPSLIRDYLSYNLARQLGDYATRTQYCEIILNGDYIGLYVLQEKIKADSNRVNVIKISSSSNTLPNLSGGYITKADKTTGGDPVAWSMQSSIPGEWVDFIHELPKPENVTAEQDAYIHSQFTYLQAVSNSTSITTGYPSVIDVPSFIDYMILAELASNADSYQLSTYFHKDRNGKLRAGPIWDYNLTYGNDLFLWGYDRSHYDVWQFGNGDNQGASFWQTLFNNPTYKCYFARRWGELTQPNGPLHPDQLDAFIDDIVAEISDAAAREEGRWGTVPDLLGEIDNMKGWLSDRINWISAQLPATTPCSNVVLPSLVINRIHYHPDTNSTYPNSDDQEFLSIRNTGTTTVNLTGIYFRGTGFVYQFPANQTLAAGATVYLASKPAVFQIKYGFAPYGSFTRNLSNSDKDLILADAFGNVIDEVHYYDSAPWPDADGNGSYLRLVNDSYDNALASSWEAVSDATLGVETEAMAVYTVTPNPAHDFVTVTTSLPVQELALYDLSGRLIREWKPTSTEAVLDVSGLSSGVYLLTGKAGATVVRSRVIIE